MKKKMLSISIHVLLFLHKKASLLRVSTLDENNKICFQAILPVYEMPLLFFYCVNLNYLNYDEKKKSQRINEKKWNKMKMFYAIIFAEVYQI